jgi:hypothetical protein
MMLASFRSMLSPLSCEVLVCTKPCFITWEEANCRSCYFCHLNAHFDTQSRCPPLSCEVLVCTKPCFITWEEADMGGCGIVI